ncbi:hypothetical protein CYLTODRAFT_37263 [Cylindrobasidium torrendii FP15055 ss-10]|uniref:Uncharacterized protein n=1 Tax=Cylindrobasidium torrendii FP15055 ss-10 TaxID=1314674 RepID=A0A0D7BPJ3_9AGAR|nr:hypothetical protein CYLTODRAFT_37263 [Cylindrobasidium torrendii FP15055 ss-10]
MNSTTTEHSRTSCSPSHVVVELISVLVIVWGKTLTGILSLNESARAVRRSIPSRWTQGLTSFMLLGRFTYDLYLCPFSFLHWPQGEYFSLAYCASLILGLQQPLWVNQFALYMY